MSVHEHKKKIIIIAAIAVLVIGAIAYGQYRKANQPSSYQTVKAVKGDLVQTVEATGKVKSADDLALKFELSGTIGEVRVKEGDQVKSGDVLIRLRAADLDAAVAQASANLNQKLAGATKEDISYYQSAVDLAKASLDQAKADATYLVASAELAVDTAKNNLKLAEGGESSQIVTDAYDDAIASLQTSISTMDNSLTQADNILGVDNSLANDDFEQFLATADPSKLDYAKSLYPQVKLEVNSARNQIISLSGADHASVDSALVATKNALNRCVQLLAAVKEVLNITSPMGSLSQSSLDTKKTTIETARSNASAYSNTISNVQQAIDSAKNSYTTYSIAYTKAQQDLENTRSTVTSNIAMKEASYNQALANLNSKKNPPREVDVAAYRAALSQAIANRNKASIVAPIDGVVTQIAKMKGEFISMSETAIEMLSPHYEVDVDIPETDVVKVAISDVVSITLDAYGDDIKFTGKVMSIDPASTEVQDVVYYKIKVALDPSEKEIKPGMTANVTVSTDTRTNVLYVPLRAVRTSDMGKKSVRILVNGAPEDRDIVIGMRADNGQVEVVSGINEGDDVIVSVTTK